MADSKCRARVAYTERVLHGKLEPTPARPAFTVKPATTRAGPTEGHSGTIGDYLLWIVIGTGGVWALTLR